MVLPTEIPESLRGRPFTVTQARLAGVNERVLRGARFTQLFRDVYAEATLPVDTRLRACGLRLVLPRQSTFCLQTAAELYGLPVKDDVLHVCVADPSARPRHREGLRIHETVSRQDIRVHNGLPLTTPERTYLDLASVLDLIMLVVVGDAMLRAGLTTLDSLRTAVAPVRRRRGVVLARTALPYLRERVDSPMESRLRMLLVLAGLPCPVPNLDIRDESGQWLSRPDLAYPDLKIAIEYEGDHHRTDRRQWRDDVYRHELLHDLGWVVLLFHADDVLRRPELTVERVRSWIMDRSAAR